MLRKLDSGRLTPWWDTRRKGSRYSSAAGSEPFATPSHGVLCAGPREVHFGTSGPAKSASGETVRGSLWNVWSLILQPAQRNKQAGPLGAQTVANPKIMVKTKTFGHTLYHLFQLPPACGIGPQKQRDRKRKNPKGTPAGGPYQSPSLDSQSFPLEVSKTILPRVKFSTADVSQPDKAPRRLSTPVAIS